MRPRREPSLDDSEKGGAADSLLPSEERQSRPEPRDFRRGTHITVLLVISHTLLALVGVLLGTTWRPDANAFAARVTARYSPFIEDVGLKFNTVQFNGSFFNETDFRLDAGPKVDAAWRSLGVDYRALRVPEDQAEASGLAHDQVKISPKYDGGYPANVEGLHHLHCLNLLRQSLSWNIDHYRALGEGAFKNDEGILKSHVTHCLDILRQQLMCTVDVGMLGQVWWDQRQPKAFVDFNTKHTCRNFEDVRRWAEKRQLPEEVPGDFLKGPEPGDRVYAEIP